ncbi:MAG: OmpA family protein [Chlorobi bacterium]|nr:OmpA family protein [Chlorobiota bacterium]
MRTFLSVFIATTIASLMLAQPARIGVHSGINANFHAPSFPATPQPGGPQYNTSATSVTGTVGAIGQIPLSSTLALGLRVAYNAMGNVTLPSSNAIFSYNLRPSLPYVELLPTIGISDLLVSKSLWLWGGLDVGFPLSPTYSRDSSGSANITDATIPDAQTRLAIAVGASYDIPLSEQWILQPELSFRFPLTSVSSNANFDSWKVSQLRIGVNLFYSLATQSTDTTRPPKEPYVRSRIGRVVTIRPNGDTSDVRTISLEDVRYTESFPIVPYVFFPANSSTHDKFYRTAEQREAGEAYAVDTLKDALAVNAHVLSLVCRRMNQYPTARLTIIGTTDGRSEARNRSLSLQRALAIKSQLVACGVDSSRISIEARELPEKPSAPNDPDGIVENRRVEFRSSTPEILEPSQSRVGIERLANPDAVLFLPEVATSDPIAKWELTITQAGRQLRIFRGEGTPRPITWTIQPSELSPKQVPIDYTFHVESVVGRTSESSGSLAVDYISSTRPLQERTGDKTIQKFSLILFDFDSDVITADNRRILDLRIVPAIVPGSKVSINGYTDRIGDARYNLDLSRRRAQAVMDYLKSKRPNAQYQIAGYGETIERYDNDLPTGRQLSRTVQIIIETPKQ